MSAGICPLPTRIAHQQPPHTSKPSAPKTLLPPTIATLEFPQTILADPIPSAAAFYAPSGDSQTPFQTTIQYSIHTAGRHMARELPYVFPDLQHAAGKTGRRVLDDVLVIPTFQKSNFDLVAVTPETNWERDLLLEF
ncbi:hypothetical protein HK104_011201, partial [Borealophlyctis nickersoniae]